MANAISRQRPRGLVPALSAFAAGLFVYAIHHDPLQSHAVEAVAFAVVVPVLAVLAVAAAAASRSFPDPAPVVILSGCAPSVAEADRSDLDFCTALHADSLAHGFFVGLGPRFLRAYYRTFIDSPHGALLIARLEREAVGFVCGATDPARHTKWVLRHRGVRLLVLAIGALPIRPRVALRFATTRVRRYLRAWRSRKHRQRDDAESPAAHLSHVAVLAGAREAGIGSALLLRYLDVAWDAGAERVRLFTRADAQGAGAFYARRGWLREGSRLNADGELMIQWSAPTGNAIEAST